MLVQGPLAVHFFEKGLHVAAVLGVVEDEFLAVLALCVAGEPSPAVADLEMVHDILELKAMVLFHLVAQEVQHDGAVRLVVAGLGFVVEDLLCGDGSASGHQYAQKEGTQDKTD